jgi:plasmid stabilization system protein ParE
VGAAEDHSLSCASITWTRAARHSFRELLAYLKAQEYSDPAARAREIIAAVKRLADWPCLGLVTQVRRGKTFRRLVIGKRFLVYYIYFPPRSAGQQGRVSIRAVKHGARRQPFAGVREPIPAAYHIYGACRRSRPDRGDAQHWRPAPRRLAAKPKFQNPRLVRRIADVYTAKTPRAIRSREVPPHG